ncbi:hypothetical protein KY329_02175 [Candidatus Woesearchaeota archaeon]|nr:hypothetical protein [Candidatus Woesearchaeota archaeon]
MRHCPPDKVFWVQDGRTIKNLQELERALQNMTQDTFKHHVNADKNDFAAWLEQVMREKTLAKLIKTARTKDNMRRLVEKRIEEVQKPMKKAKKVQKKTKRKAVMNEEFRSIVEPASHHIALAAHISLGIVVGSALTLLVLMIL